MSDYNSFKAEWTGRRINHDRVYGYQCVDLILQYASQVLGITGLIRGNAIDYWTVPSTAPNYALFDRVDRLATTDCQQGDIVVMRTLGRNDFSGDGHIGICDRQDSSNVWLLEQNAVGTGNGTERDAIGVYRSLPKSRIAGILRPRPVAQPPQPVLPPYNVEMIPPREMVVTRDTYKWDLNYHNFQAVSTHPIEAVPAGYRFMAQAVYRSTSTDSGLNQYTYYSPDSRNSGCYNTADCTEYIAPAPVAPPPTSPPAAPVKAPLAERYELLTELVYFGSAKDAALDQNALGMLDKKKRYIVYSRANNMVNLTLDNQKDQNLWINPRMNKADVAPTLPEPATLPVDIKPTVIEPTDVSDNTVAVPEQLDADNDWMDDRPVRADGYPQKMIAIKNATLYDLTGKFANYPIQLNAGNKLDIVSYFYKENEEGELTKYYRDKIFTAKGYYYSLSEDLLVPFKEPVARPEPLQPLPPIRQRQSLDYDNNGRVNIDDVSAFIDYASTRFSSTIKQAVTVLQPKIEETRKRVGKSIDGFNRRQK